jgi:hypothetical protein
MPGLRAESADVPSDGSRSLHATRHVLGAAHEGKGSSHWDLIHGAKLMGTYAKPERPVLGLTPPVATRTHPVVQP